MVALENRSSIPVSGPATETERPGAETAKAEPINGASFGGSFREGFFDQRGSSSRERNFDTRSGIAPAGAGLSAGAPDVALNLADAAAQTTFAQIARERGQFDVAAEQAKLEIGSGAYDYLAAAEARKAEMAGGAANARMTQSQLQAASTLNARAGQFAGAEERSDSLTDLNMRKGGALGVIGLNYSPLAPGARSDDAQGAAFSGRLNYSDGDGVVAVNEEVRFFDQGGPLSQRIAHFAGALREALERANAQYQTSSPDFIKFTGANLESARSLLAGMRRAMVQWREFAAGWKEPGAIPADPAPEIVEER